MVLGVAHVSVLTSCLASLEPGIESRSQWGPEKGHKHPLLQGGTKAPTKTSSQSPQAGAGGQPLPRALQSLRTPSHYSPL